MLFQFAFTLYVFITTIEQAFSAIKHVINVFRNKIEKEFLADSIMIYIE
jgi:hypothetical protein